MGQNIRVGIQVSTPELRRGSFREEQYQAQAAFRCALRTFERFAETQVRQEGVTPQQHLVLVVVRGHRSFPRVSLNELSDSLKLSQSATSLLVERCVQRGLVEREEDPEDRRRVAIWLTDRGQEVLDRVMAENRRRLASLRQDLLAEAFWRELETEEKLEA